ncbi:Cytochrome P450 83B1 [Linum perenne]
MSGHVFIYIHTQLLSQFTKNMSSLIYLLLALPLLLLLLLQKHRKMAKANLPPGPPGLPLIGNLLQVQTSALHRYLWQLSQTYGPLMSLKLGSAQVVVVSTAKMAEQVMKTHDLIFCNRPKPALGPQKLSYNYRDITFATYGDYWKEIRNLCMLHLFSANRVQSFRPIREYEVSKLIDNISKSSSGSIPFNLSEAMISLTITIICQVAFGKRYKDGAEISRVQSLLTESQTVLTNFLFSDFFPLLGFIDRFTGSIGRLHKSFRDLDGFYQGLIDENLDPNRGKPEQEDILGVMLRIQEDQSSKVQLTIENIKAILMNIFIAGTDTSAATVVWSMTYLMKNPTIMRKVQEEIRGVIGEKKGFVDEEGIQHLPYMKAVVKEVMRLQPAAPLLVPRQSSEECNIGGYEIPAKTIVHVNAWAIGRDVEAWGENPEVFKPERFIGSSIDLKGADFELIPFGAGRRKCPASNMGLVTVELSLANLLYAFDWEMPQGMKREDLDMDVLPGITMHKKNALCLVATKCY